MYYINKHNSLKRVFVTATLLFAFLFPAFVVQPSFALLPSDPGGSTTPTASSGSSTTGGSSNAPTDQAATSGNCASASKCDLVQQYLNPFINFLAALVGVAVVISIVIGGIQYGSSAGDPQKAAAAKSRIRNSIIALLTFLFLFALLNFLIPGGLF